MASKEAADGQTVDVVLEWRDVETLLVDQIIGITNVDQLPRATFAQLVFSPNQPNPNGRPVVTLASSVAGWQRIRDQIGLLIENSTQQRGDEVLPPKLAQHD